MNAGEKSCEAENRTLRKIFLEKKVQIYSRFCLADKDLVCIFAMFFAKEISCLFCKKL